MDADQGIHHGRLVHPYIAHVGEQDATVSRHSYYPSPLHPLRSIQLRSKRDSKIHKHEYIKSLQDKIRTCCSL